jgi:hypothetical protein
MRLMKNGAFKRRFFVQNVSGISYNLYEFSKFNLAGIIYILNDN